MNDTNNQELKDLSFINEIKSMAVIGTSQKREFFFLMSHKENFKGNIYAIHPKLNQIPGFDNGSEGRIFSSLKDVPEDIDYAYITVPPSQILDVMSDCVKKGVKLASIFTAEFSDSGTHEGEALEKDLLKKADNKVRLLGPNGMGMYYPRLGIAWRYKFPTTIGNIGFISQSGGISNLVIYSSINLGIAFSKVFSFGNGADVDFVDLLNYLENDNETEIITCYLEGIKPERGEALKRVLTSLKKPLIVVKGGRTKAGSKAAQTHTAAISGSEKVWDALFDQYNIIRVDTIEQLLHAAKLMDFYGLFNVKNVALFSISGGYGVVLADLLEKYGLKVPQFSPNIQQKLKEKFFTLGTSSRNPLDVSTQVFATESMRDILDIALSDDKIDALIMDLPSWYLNQDYHIRKNSGFEKGILEAFTSLKQLNKVVVVIIQTANCLEDKTRAVKFLTEQGIPVFENPLEFVELLSKISKYTQKKNARSAI
ncbi:MAG: CoA-binding protein [Candidatus Lokiarchaeota archaeon]|nr:CoA-binding protein [Candidatus Lokiarchaeota archaeon]